MHDQPMLSDAEWALVTELLLMERDDLPVEIRHCRSASMREELHRRQELVEGLLHQLQASPVV